MTGLYGTVDVDQGGTGASTVEEALENLGLTDLVRLQTQIIVVSGDCYENAIHSILLPFGNFCGLLCF